MKHQFLKSFLKGAPWLLRLVRRIKHPTSPVPLGVWLANSFFQRILRINGDVPWMVHYTSCVTKPENITIGANVWRSFAISGGCYIQAINGIEIGDDTIFAPGVKMISANHNPQDLHHWIQGEPIEIGRDCWIGANAVILPGVRLGCRCVVGAGAVVTRSFDACSIVAGVPAKKIATVDWDH